MFKVNTIQQYLTSNLLNDRERKLILQIRPKMYPGIKCNFKKLFPPGTSCPLDCEFTHTDSQ